MERHLPYGMTDDTVLPATQHKWFLYVTCVMYVLSRFPGQPARGGQGGGGAGGTGGGSGSQYAEEEDDLYS